ncbi:hypothetical protein OUZ56_007415 [Daphnia magna]|uniref:Uncharacterized protein n=1 Tax=Daphnia magna TaxID=35525 RepID=A0ABR0A9X5_9CRUS|nr:hypothetical protein OUZ56_007415 [Daphnia magna]
MLHQNLYLETAVVTRQRIGSHFTQDEPTKLLPKVSRGHAYSIGTTVSKVMEETETGAGGAALVDNMVGNIVTEWIVWHSRPTACANQMKETNKSKMSRALKCQGTFYVS